MNAIQDKIDTRIPGISLVASSIVALAVALPTGIGRLDLAGMTLVLVVWTVWFLAVGTLMIQRKV